jgi:hypothetical protein
MQQLECIAQRYDRRVVLRRRRCQPRTRNSFSTTTGDQGLQSRNVGYALLANWFAASVQHRKVNPAEISALARRPDHCPNRGGTKIESQQRFDEAGWVR